MSKAVAKWVLVAVGIIALLVTGALALPLRLWRTGEVPLPELEYSALPHEAAKPVPMATPPLPMRAVWHQRHRADPLHR